LTPNNALGYYAFGDPEDNDVGFLSYNHTNDTMGFAAAGAGIEMTWDGNSLYNFDATDPEFRLSDNTINAKLKIVDGSSLAYTGTVSSHMFQLRTNNTAALTVDTSQNIGIGTTTPASKLQVYVSNTTTASPIASLKQNSTGDAGLGFVLGAANSYVMGIDNSDSDSFKLSYGSAANAALGTNDYLTLTTAGALGVGTTTPGRGLHVYGSGSSYLRVERATRSGGEVGIELSGASGGNTWAIAQPAAADYLMFYGGGATRMMISNNSGNVGIGTTTPNQALTLFRNGADAAVEFSTVSGANEKWTIGIDDSDGAKFKISSSSALGTNDRFTINGSGNVGIGDNTPTEGTLVVGSAGAGSIFFTPTASTTVNKALCGDNAGATVLYDCGASPIADYAESYATTPDVAFGHIVMMTSELVTQTDGEKTPRLTKAVRGGSVIGIASNNFSDFTSTGQGAFRSTETTKPIALNGRVPVKVNLEGGPIAQGDRIALSSVPGVGKKAKESGESTVGIALAPYTAMTNGDSVLVFVDNDAYQSMTDLVRAELLDIDLNSTTTVFATLLQSDTDTIWNRIVRLAEGFVDGVLTLSGLRTDELCVGDVCVSEAEFREMVENRASAQGAISPNPTTDEPAPSPEPVPDSVIDEPAPEPSPEPITVTDEPAPEPAPDPVAEGSSV
jgi:hypothetical protein